MNSTHPTPTYSLESEQSVLGGLLLDNSAWERIADLISESDFYRAEHRLIFRHAMRLVQQDQTADVITVSDSLERTQELRGVGGITYLANLAQNIPGAANIRRYAEIVREHSVFRSLAEVATAISQIAAKPRGLGMAEALDQAEAMVLAVADAGSRSSVGFRALGALITTVVERVDDLFQRGAEVVGLASGLTDLDRMTSGFQPGDLIILAGRASMGKTACRRRSNFDQGCQLNFDQALWPQQRCCSCG